jgi:hypothetical protein
MRTAPATTVLAAALAVTSALGPGVSAALAAPAATGKPPTPRQVARAVTAAEKSPSLWATINICNSRTHRDQIGVRGQMPSLGFSSEMAMTVTLNAWNATSKKFVAIPSPNAVDTIPLGAHSRGLEQDGTVFPFQKGQTGLWNATILFTWKRHGKTVGQTQLRTTSGHRSADFGSPPHYSAAQCRIS